MLLKNWVSKASFGLALIVMIESQGCTIKDKLSMKDVTFTLLKVSHHADKKIIEITLLTPQQRQIHQVYQSLNKNHYYRNHSRLFRLDLKH